MSILGNDLLLGSGDEGYNLTRSLRFRKSASTYLNRTMTTATDAKKWTWSGWVKRGSFDQSGLIASGNSTTDGSGITFVYGTGASLCFYDYISSTFTTNLVSTQVFRDPAAWYHIVVAVDTTQATASNRVKMYVNGTQITSFSAATYPALNSTGYMNSGTYATTIGREGGFGNYYDGYLTEVNFIDGQALTPSSFGETDTITGVWKPKRYAGTYGTNGFYLPFTDNSALTTSSNVGLGKDFSGNGNYWTTNNISITAGTTYDSMTDVPTLTSATAANFPVFNPLIPSGQTITQGNLLGINEWCQASINIPNTGKWYAEFTCYQPNSVSDSNNFYVVVGTAYYAFNGNKYSGGWVSYGASYTNGDVIGAAVDIPNGTVTYYKNNVSQGSQSITANAETFFAIRCINTGNGYYANFGQRPFTYTPPTGFVALNTYNLPTSTIVKGNTVMDATTYTGTGAIQSIVNAGGFKPDLVWIKNRVRTSFHDLVDSVRGVAYGLSSNDTRAEITPSLVTSLNSNGFTLPANTTSDTFFTNLSGEATVAWQWQAGQGTTSSNTNGNVTSTVSVNASAGFSVVTYTVTSTASMTIGHGLGVAPQLIIEKRRDGATNWDVYTAATGNTGRLQLNSTAAFDVQAGVWNNTTPTSTVFSQQGNGTWHSIGVTCVAYCWTPIAGYSAFSSYSGNGSSDGVFVYTGFQPKFIIIKRTDTTGNWTTFDSARDPYNQAGKLLYPNYSNAEETDATQKIDFLSNGFKLRGSNANENASGGTYVYMAFATNPFKQSLAF